MKSFYRPIRFVSSSVWNLNLCGVCADSVFVGDNLPAMLVVNRQPGRAAVVFDGAASITHRHRGFGADCGWKWRLESGRRIDNMRKRSPSVPSTWPPTPAEPRYEDPLSEPVGHPSPWIRRDPGGPPRRRHPISVRVWVPVCADTIRLPAVAATHHVGILPVVA